MKRNLWIALLLGICTLSYAQDRNGRKSSPIVPARKQLQLEFTTGATFDLINHGSNPDAAFFGSKKPTTPQFGFKITHLFSPKMGWYLNTQLNFYGQKAPAASKPNIIDDIWKEFVKLAFGPINYYAHPELEAGFLYRIEAQRWRLHPHIGIGYTRYLSNANDKRTITSGEDKRSTHYRQQTNCLFMDFGFSVNYYLTNNTYLLLNTGYHHPLQKSYARLTHISNGVETEEVYYKVPSAGRNIYTNIGIGFCLWKKQE